MRTQRGSSNPVHEGRFFYASVFIICALVFAAGNVLSSFQNLLPKQEFWDGQPILQFQQSEDASSPLAAAAAAADHHHVGGKFAYAFIVGGCSLTSCLGYLLNVIVANQVLKDHNSTSDVVFQVRMASSINETRLPIEHETWLHKSGILLKYLPKVRVDNFGTATLEKFRVLEMTEYDRVRFLDADLIPLCNVDDELEASYNGQLQEYVGKQGSVAPVSACDFIVTPKKGLFKQVMDIVHRKRNKKTQPNTTNLFDPLVGWGDQMIGGDEWKGSNKRGTTWNFYGATIDQGIIYQWLKYEMLNWSHVVMKGKNDFQVQTWQEVTHSRQSNSNIVAASGQRYTAIVNKTEYKSKTCMTTKGWKLSNLHYNGNGKPWNKPILSEDIPDSYSKSLNGRDKGRGIWLFWLGMANRTKDLQLPSAMLFLNKSTPAGFSSGDKSVLFRPEVEVPKPR
jgi:hypothetical protein